MWFQDTQINTQMAFLLWTEPGSIFFVGFRRFVQLGKVLTRIIRWKGDDNGMSANFGHLDV